MYGKRLIKVKQQSFRKNKQSYERDKGVTSANFFDKENPLFLVLSEGTKHELKAPGKDWNRCLSMPKVRICKNRQ